MDPKRRHRYTGAIVVAGALVLIGSVIVVNRAGVTSPGNTNGLNINGVIQGTNSPLPIPIAPPPTKPTAVDVPFTKINTPTNTTPTTTTPETSDTPFDWGTIIQALTHVTKSVSTGNDSSTTNPFSFIPSGLISIPEPQSSMTMPDSEKPLYSWGQEAGNVILSFETSHPDQPQILTDFIQDRQNQAKIDAMKKLGADLSAVGDGIAAIDPTPPQMTMAAPALAAAYHEIGRNLSAIPDAKGNDALVKAILTYDKSAEAFGTKYVQVVNILQANGVKYSQSEPGGVFMFPSQ